MGKLGFRVDEHHKDGEFVQTGMAAADREVDEALDDYESGRLTGRELIDRMDAIVEKHPELIEAHVTKGYVLFKAGHYSTALEAYAKGVAAGEAALPKGYAWTTPWGQLENRPFLRALHGQAMAMLALADDRGLAILDRIMALNPGDNQGIRYILASEHLRRGTPGRIDRAIELAEEAHTAPTLHFDLALHRFREGRVIDAIVAVRKGVLASPFVLPGILEGARHLREPRVYREVADVDAAKAYLRGGERAWSKVPGARDFIDWIGSQPAIGAEMDLRRRHDIALESDDHKVRVSAFGDLREAQDAVDLESSEEIARLAGVDLDADWTGGVPTRSPRP